MPAQLRIFALGAVMDLTFAEPVSATFVDAVAHAWSRCLADGATTGAVLASPSAASLTVGAPRDESDESTRAALQRLSQDVTHHLIASQAGRLLMFHAGALCHPETGASVVFVAPSGTGKTTLARLLGRTHGYLTDETVGIEPATGRIYAYPKPLSIGLSTDRRKFETSPDDLGLLLAHASPTVTGIVLLHRAEGAHVSAHADELGTLDAVAALIPETSALNRLPRPLHAMAALLDRTGPVIGLTYCEARHLAPVVSDLVEEAA